MQEDGTDKSKCGSIRYISCMVTQIPAWATIRQGPRVQDGHEHGGGRNKGTSPEVLVAPAGEPSSEALVIEGSNATDMDDADFVYDRTRFYKYKAH
jgi:hypothetical protein